MGCVVTEGSKSWTISLNYPKYDRDLPSHLAATDRHFLPTGILMELE